MKMKRFKALRKRLNKLEDAHLALAAQHLALTTVCRFTLRYVPIDSAEVSQAAARAYDLCNENMEGHGHDEAYQAAVRFWLDQFFGELFVAANTRPRPQSAL